MIFEETKQPFCCNSAYRFGGGANCGKGRIQKWSESEIIKPDDRHVFRDADTMLMQSLEGTDGGIIVPCKYSIERDPLSVAQKMIQGFISDVAFEFTIQNKNSRRREYCGLPGQTYIQLRADSNLPDF